MNLTPLDIRNQEFRRKPLGGLDPEEVHSFLAQVAAEYELRLKEAQDSGDKLKLAKDQLSHFHTIESTLQETAITLQKILEEKKAQAQKEAEFIIAEAKNNAYKETEAIRRESEKLRSEIVGLRAQKAAFFSRIRNALRTQEELLEAMERDEMDQDGLDFEVSNEVMRAPPGRVKRQSVRDIHAKGPGIEAVRSQVNQPLSTEQPPRPTDPQGIQGSQSSSPQLAKQAAPQTAVKRPIPSELTDPATSPTSAVGATSEPVATKVTKATKTTQGILGATGMHRSTEGMSNIKSTGLQIETDQKPKPAQ